MLHHALRNAEEASGTTPQASFVFVYHLMWNPPGGNSLATAIWWCIYVLTESMLAKSTPVPF